MRNELTRERLLSLFQEIARDAPSRGAPFRVYLVGGGTAVWAGWREASIDADLFSESEELFEDVQGMKELFSKVVRGFRRDLDDARHFLESGMVDADRFRELIDRVPESAFARYPSLSPNAVRRAVDDFLQAEE